MEDVKALYDTRIRPLLMASGLPEWTRESIRGHLTGAHGTGQISVLKRRHEEFLGPLLEEMRGHVMMQMNGRRMPNYKGISEYRKMVEHLMRDCVDKDV